MSWWSGTKKNASEKDDAVAKDNKLPQLENEPAPIVPRSTNPQFLTPDGKTCFGAEEEYHFRVFDLFRTFGEFFNHWRSSAPFRLQELLDTKITYRHNELDFGPNYGHRYDIYFYRYKVGLLQISASRMNMSEAGLRLSENVDQPEHEVHVDILLDPFSTTMIPFKEIREFVGSLARMTTSKTKNCFYTDYQGVTQRQYANNTIDRAMMELLWNSHNVSRDKAQLLMFLFYSGVPTEWYQMVTAK